MNFEVEKEYATKWLVLNGFGQFDLSNPIELYALDGNIGAIYFDLNPNGYLIINTFNYDIMEYSFNNKQSFEYYDHVIYNGPLQYYIETEGNTIDLFTDSIVNKEDLSTNYIQNKISIDDQTQKIQNLDSLITSLYTDNILDSNEVFNERSIVNATSNSFFETGSLTSSLVTWSSDYYCQVDSAAILLRYLYSNKSTSFLPSSYTTNGNVQSYLSNKYIINAGTNSYNVVYGGDTYREYNGSTLETKTTKGMNQYLIDRGLSSSYSVGYSMYNFNTIKNVINSNFPISLGSSSSVPGATWRSNHQVVAHSYMVGYDGVPFIYVNDTFGNNNISINGSSTYYTNFDMWYITKQ